MNLTNPPNPPTSQKTKDKMSDRLLVGCWLFIGGSLLFVGEAIAELTHAISPPAIIHLAEGLLFLIGSCCFLPKTTKH